MSELEEILKLLVSRLGDDCLSKSSIYKYVDDYAPKADKVVRTRVKTALMSGIFANFKSGSDFSEAVGRIRNELLWPEDYANEMTHAFASAMGIEVSMEESQEIPGEKLQETKQTQCDQTGSPQHVNASSNITPQQRSNVNSQSQPTRQSASSSQQTTSFANANYSRSSNRGRYSEDCSPLGIMIGIVINAAVACLTACIMTRSYIGDVYLIAAANSVLLYVCGMIAVSRERTKVLFCIVATVINSVLLYWTVKIGMDRGQMAFGVFILAYFHLVMLLIACLVHYRDEEAGAGVSDFIRFPCCVFAFASAFSVGCCFRGRKWFQHCKVCDYTAGIFIGFGCNLFLLDG